MSENTKLYEIVNTDDNGRAISSLGTVYATGPKDAEEKAAVYFKNPEIATTGYYYARLPKASIIPENAAKYWDNKIREAKSTLIISER